MKNKKMKDVLENIARRSISDDVNVLSKVSVQLKRKSLMMTLRTRPVLMVLVILLSLLFLSSVVYAIGKATGYIPGVGLIDQSMPLRVLSEPVSITRDEITITVTSALLSADKTVIFLQVENVPSDVYPNSESDGGCLGKVDLRLENGNLLTGGFIHGGNWNTFEQKLEYASIPVDIDEATLLVACIGGTIDGRLPKNWEIPIRFIPAPPELTVMPIVEIQPTSAPSLESNVVSPLSIMKVIEVGDTYVMFTEFSRDSTGDSSVPLNAWWMETDQIDIKDGKGNDLNYTIPNDIELPAPTQPNSQVFAVQFSKNFIPPVKIVYHGLYTWKTGEPQVFEFDFDAGAAPQVGQSWSINKDFIVADTSFRLLSIKAISQGNYEGYTFYFELPDDTSLFAENGRALSIENLELEGNTTLGGGGGTGEISKVYEKIPTGMLKVIFSVSQIVSGSKKDFQIQWSPENVSTALYGISLKLDKFIPLDDGYYLIGHSEWTDNRVMSVVPSGWTFKAYDINGYELQIQPAIYDDDVIRENLQPNQWAYRLYGKNFNGPVTLRATQMGIEFTQPIRFNLDLGVNNFDFTEQYLGRKWKLGLIPIDIPGILANATTATYIKTGDLKGFEIAIKADPVLQTISFNYESGLNTEGLAGISGGGGAYRDETTGTIFSSALTNAPMGFPIVFSTNTIEINGVWETIWNPPVDTTNSQPVFTEQACLDLPRWKQISTNGTVSLPVDLSGKILTMRGALSPEPSLFISNIDGSAEQGLVFGNGALSPDGTRLVYSDENGLIKMLEIATGSTTTLNIPSGSTANVFWSPDGQHIAFDLFTNTYQVFVMDADGENLRQLTFENEMTFAFGWSGDSKQVLISSLQRDNRNALKLIGIETGLISDLWNIQGEQAAISADNQWIAFVDKVNGRMGNGIYISRLDGTDKRLVVQLDYWFTISPVWSPDSNWVGFSVLNTDLPTGNLSLGAININSCEAVLLGEIDGAIRSWIVR